ncbi:hypothetical protein D9M71_125140 [compost metagenome]
MTQTDLFKLLGAPLANSRWSWGGIRAEDGAVFLRVWQDRKRKHDGHWYMMVTHHEKYAGNEENLGYKERLDHVERIRKGAPCYMVMCCAEDESATPRKVKSFNSDEVFVGGYVVELNGDTCVEMVERRSVASVRVQSHA